MKKLFLTLILLSLVKIGFGQLRDLKPGFNLFSPQQDIQVGEEAAAQVQQQQPVVQNTQLSGYLTNLLKRLSSTTHGQSEFPYRINAIASKDINAFALPGGPIFVYTGLINEASNEAELAGVIAHEMSHVRLRHGTNQASQANLIELPFALAEKATGSGTLGQLARLGINIGFNSVLLKMSRGHESEADYNGAQVMAEAGYNPIAMAQFFEKLQAKGGSQGGLAQFLSDHPSPGNRLQAVEEEIRQMPARRYATDSGQFAAIKQTISKIRTPATPAPISQR